MAELAQAIGCEESVIQATLDRYNELCDKGVDEDFHKSGHNMVRVAGTRQQPLQSRPKTENGAPRSDAEAEGEVAHVEGEAASGNVSGSMFYDTYPHHIAGVSTGRGLTFGYLLGRRLAGVEEPCRATRYSGRAWTG